MVRKPDDAREQSHGFVDKLYTDPMAAQAAADVEGVPMALLRVLRLKS